MPITCECTHWTGSLDTRGVDGNVRLLSLALTVIVVGCAQLPLLLTKRAKRSALASFSEVRVVFCSHVSCPSVKSSVLWYPDVS